MIVAKLFSLDTESGLSFIALQLIVVSLKPLFLIIIVYSYIIFVQH